MRRSFSCFILSGLLLIPVAGRAVLFYSTGDPTYNTAEPTGVLTNSGWQFQGTFLQYLGTPISPHHFITAEHFGGSVGNTFNFDGTTYTTIAKTVDSGSDLALYEIDGTFSHYAPLYDSSGEVGKDLVVHGRGTQRGTAVVANGDTKGWEWGSYDFVMRWGENNVAGVADYAVGGDEKLLRAEFNSGGGANECILSDKDSGGGLFIEDSGTWKLAGINYAIFPSSFSYSASGTPSFNAAIFDYSFKASESEKVYYQSEGSWYLETANGEEPCSFYVTRISSRYDWITNNIPDFDQDVDGLPDWWETLHGETEAGADPDDDGFTNYEEWLADTVPNDSNSFFRVVDYSVATNLVFSSSTNRKYQVQYRTNLADTNEVWQTEADWFDGLHPQTVQSVSTSTSNRFYRVRVKLR